jgi:hypothetical protein
MFTKNTWLFMKWTMISKTENELTWHEQCSPNKMNLHELINVHKKHMNLH